jgi:putative transcriptional regulator
MGDHPYHGWYVPPVPFTAELADGRARFGARLRQLRKRAALKQEQLAERAGIDRKSISRMENAQHSPALDVIFQVARALGVEPGELFHRQDKDGFAP